MHRAEREIVNVGRSGKGGDHFPILITQRGEQIWMAIGGGGGGGEREGDVTLALSCGSGAVHGGDFLFGIWSGRDRKVLRSVGCCMWMWHWQVECGQKNDER